MSLCVTLSQRWSSLVLPVQCGGAGDPFQQCSHDCEILLSLLQQRRQSSAPPLESTADAMRQKQLLSNLNIKFKAYDLDLMAPHGMGTGWQEFVAQSTGQRTVPMIWVKGRFIGGSSDLQALQASGQLTKMLAGK